VLKRLIRPAFNKAASLFGIPEVQSRLDSVENKLNAAAINEEALKNLERRATDLAMAKFVPLRDKLKAVADHAEIRLMDLNKALVEYVDAKQLQNIEAIEAFKSEQLARISEIRQSVDTIRRQLSTAPRTPSATISPAAVSPNAPVIDDALYVALENHFRGSRDVVAQRQQDYLPRLPSVISEATPLIDLGCGRGEWLKVLKLKNISALGVDSNSVCIAECKEENLNVVESDLLAFLSNRPDASVGTYTLFQVLEHLPFPVLIEALREMRRTLVPGGRLIAEVPNAKNLRVSAGTFWIDPTHQRPLFPELLMFLATEVGFSNADGVYANNLAPQHDLSGLPDGATNALRSVVDAVDGPGDFALIATA
jgi:SAM-dependent methyltransferase